MDDPEIKYFLGTYNNPDINNFKELSEQDFEFFAKCIATLEKLSADENLFHIVELNYNDLKSKITSYLTSFIDNHKADFYEFSHIFLDINRLILNFLSSIRTFLDHTETRLKRQFGEDSEEYQLFKAETNKAYDENFEYRFLYKLRNYAQHCGLPSGSAEINSFENENNEPTDVFLLYFVRDELLKEYDGWGSQIKNELKTQLEKFDIIPFIDKKFKLLKRINEILCEKIATRYRKEGDLLLSLILLAQPQGGIPCLIESKSYGDTAKLKFRWFPYDHISKTTGAKINVVYTNENK